MNTRYKVTTECKGEGQMPVITVYPVSKEQYMRIQGIVHENDRKPEGKYPYVNKKGGKGE